MYCLVTVWGQCYTMRPYYSSRIYFFGPQYRLINNEPHYTYISNSTIFLALYTIHICIHVFVLVNIIPCINALFLFSTTLRFINNGLRGLHIVSHMWHIFNVKLYCVHACHSSTWIPNICILDERTQTGIIYSVSFCTWIKKHNDMAL